MPWRPSANIARAAKIETRTHSDPKVPNEPPAPPAPRRTPLTPLSLRVLHSFQMITPAAFAACERLVALSECASRLAERFGAEAERAPAGDYKAFELFERCFFAVRVATSLQLRLWREPSPAQDAGRQPAARTDRLDADLGLAARDRDQDRDRDREPASLPLLLKTLGGIAEDAAALPGPAPADLPTLRELLAQLTTDPVPVKPPPKPTTGLRARLAGSATAPLVTVPPPPRPSPILALHRATGPPRR